MPRTMVHVTSKTFLYSLKHTHTPVWVNFFPPNIPVTARKKNLQFRYEFKILDNQQYAVIVLPTNDSLTHSVTNQSVCVGWCNEVETVVHYFLSWWAPHSGAPTAGGEAEEEAPTRTLRAIRRRIHPLFDSHNNNELITSIIIVKNFVYTATVKEEVINFIQKST